VSRITALARSLFVRRTFPNRTAGRRHRLSLLLYFLNTTDVVTSKSSALACVRISRKVVASLPSPRSCPCPSLPLYLQWEGHSVTVVGVEMDASGDTKNLLVFDPIKEDSRLKEALQRGDLQPFRLAVCGLQPKDCLTTKRLPNRRCFHSTLVAGRYGATKDE